MATSLKLNGKTHEVDAEPGTPLLWVIRDELQLTGTKFGCGVASCGACTVHMDGVPVRSCQTYIEDVEGSEITTIEAMSEDKIGAVGFEEVQFGLGRCGGNDLRAQNLREVNRRQADAAGSSMDQDRFTGLQIGAANE